MSLGFTPGKQDLKKSLKKVLKKNIRHNILELQQQQRQNIDEDNEHNEQLKEQEELQENEQEDKNVQDQYEKAHDPPQQIQIQEEQEEEDKIIKAEERSYKDKFLQKSVPEQFQISLRAASKVLKNAQQHKNIPLSKSVLQNVITNMLKTVFKNNRQDKFDEEWEKQLKKTPLAVLDVLERSLHLEMQPPPPIEEQMHERAKQQHLAQHIQRLHEDPQLFQLQQVPMPLSKIPIRSAPSSELKLPNNITASFIINNNAKSWQDVCRRLGPWNSKFQVWKHTTSDYVNKQFWIFQGKVDQESTLCLEEIAYYDTHIRLWKYICEQKIDVALVLDDTANFRYVSRHAQSLIQAFDDLPIYCPHWDLLYVGRSTDALAGMWGGCLGQPRDASDLFAYAISLRGAQQLLKFTSPYKNPLPHVVGALHDTGLLTAASIEPCVILRL